MLYICDLIYLHKNVSEIRYIIIFSLQMEKVGCREVKSRSSARPWCVADPEPAFLGPVSAIFTTALNYLLRKAKTWTNK